MDEKHILARARRGELPAFEELVRRHEKRVYAVALRSSGSPEDAEDITQEVFLRAWRSIEEFRGDSGFSTWLFRITMNLCVDHARHKHAQPQTQPLVMGEEESERPLPDTAPTPEEHLDNSELGRELAAALDEVSEEHRRIVLLRDVSGMSYTEIAEVLEISEGTVKSRLSRARIALRKVLLRRGNLLPSAASNDVKGGGDA
ncbi:MAG TPA: sigma-70 family RNA polymerase sigma factor [Candidatus Agathobaculum stercoravium]|nr:sigma-70 family RNA polymerase sigma factor [uncultured Agathobaculum sp.]HIV96495.1 sigma-70 family RNA polymerase sigma factor [Candidatus Agathobaculum stercoravium]